MPQPLVKGYVKSNGKVPIDKFKGVPPSQLRTLEEVQDDESYDGVLADNIIMIDIDDTQQSDILMTIVEEHELDCYAEYTTRGMHFYWINDGVESCGAHKTLACGLTADIKVGCKNSVTTLKKDGKVREMAWDSDSYQKIPKWLMPIKKVPDFKTMTAGEGRNDALFQYILTLCRNGYSKDEARQCLRIINKYILPDPLEDSELELIYRDEAFPEDMWTSGEKFQHWVFGDYLINERHIINLDSILHIYRNGIYVSGEREINKAMIEENRAIRRSQRSEVMEYIEVVAPERESADSADYIAFSNGIYNRATGQLTEHTPDIVVTNRIPWEYRRGAYSEVMDRTLNKLACNDPAIRAVLEEMIGYCFYRKNELSISFILLGEKANGKTTFIKVLQHLLGKANYTAMDLDEMSGQFAVASLQGKLANIGDDISDEFMQSKNTSMFKKVTSGAAIKGEIKNDPNMKTFEPYCKLVFSANEIPRTKDRTGAVLRRMEIIPFRAYFTKDDPDYDPYIIDKLTSAESMEYLIQIGLEGLERVLKHHGFTECEAVAAEVQQYDRDNNPILGFIEECGNSIAHQPTSEVYSKYQAYCLQSGYTAMAAQTFSKEICKRMDMVTVVRGTDGKRKRTFAPRGEAIE